MKFTLVTLFPEMVAGITDYGVTSRAVKRGIISVETVNPRDFTQDKHRTVDDRPYGGGPGMVMMIAPLRAAISHAKAQHHEMPAKVVYLSPQGAPFNQAKAMELAQLPALVLVAGRYEGIDQRLLEQDVDEEISVGDFVVSGGELPAMLVMDAIARCLPDVLGHEASAVEDSFMTGLLDCPHYTRPLLDEETGMQVPQVLLSGDHAAIKAWRLQQALGQTWLKRPDLLVQKELSREEQQLLADFQRQWQQEQRKQILGRSET